MKHTLDEIEHHICLAGQELEYLRDELAERQKDGERLDWIDHHQTHPFTLPTLKDMEVTKKAWLVRVDGYDSIREAIDTAMSAERDEG